MTLSRQWIEERRSVLPSILSIDICSYTLCLTTAYMVNVMSQHADNCFNLEVLKQWIAQNKLITEESEVAMTCMEVCLSNVNAYDVQNVLIPWVHGCTGAAKHLNEPIARQANRMMLVPVISRRVDFIHKRY